MNGEIVIAIDPTIPTIDPVMQILLRHADQFCELAFAYSAFFQVEIQSHFRLHNHLLRRILFHCKGKKKILFVKKI